MTTDDADSCADMEDETNEAQETANDEEVGPGDIGGDPAIYNYQ